MKKIYSIILTAVLLCCGTSLWAEDLTLTVMDNDWSTQSVPVDGYNLDGSGGQHNQLLFLSTELSAMDGSTIKGLKFYFNRTGHSWSNASNIPNVTFRLAEVDNTSLTSQIAVDENFTQVYSGAINFDFTNKLFTVTFDAPYSYKGGNLLIDVQTTAGAYVKTSGGNNMAFYAESVSGRALKGSTTVSYCPKTTFTYEEAAVVGGCNKPKNLAISAELPDGATFTWEQNVDETVYQWACVTSGTEVTSWNTLAENVRTKTVEGLTAGTAYDFYVRSYCGEGENEQSDAVKKTFTPSCPAPTYPETPVTAKAATTATITWNAADGISKYQYICVEKNAAQDWSKLKEVATTSADLTGLTAYTEYDFYVRSWYSATSISNAVKTTFRTECAAVNAPISWNFEGETTNTVPGCWDNSGSTSTNSASEYYYVWGVYNEMLRMCNYYVKPSSGSVALINTPSIVVPASPEMELEFEYTHNSNAGDFIVKISKDAGANWTDLGTYSKGSGSSYTDPGTLTPVTISLADYAGETIILQFYAPANYDGGAIFVDNIEVRAKTSCPAPKSVTVSNVKDHTAVVAWTEKGEATAWKLQTSTDGTNWGAEISAATNPFTLTGLDASSTYYVRVKAACSELESSDWSDASDPFDTKCEAKSIPYSELFEEGTKPACWTIDNWDENAANAWTTATDFANTDYALRYNAKSLANASAIMPDITLNDKAELKFYVRNYYYSYQDSYVIGNVHITDGETFKEVAFGNNKDLTLMTVDLSDYAGKTVTITFNGFGASTYYTAYLWIDDVTISYKPVATPTNLAATPGNTTATITWDSEETGKWNLRYRPYIAEPEADWTNVANLEAKTHTIEDLTNGTTYEVQVQTIVSANRQSAWTASETFTPISCPTVNAVTFGTKTYNSVVVNWTTSGAGTWDIRYKAAGDADWTSAGTSLAATTKTLEDLTTGAIYSVEVKASCGDAWVAAAETYKPVYAAPVADAATAITDKGATFTWSAVTDATKYEYAIVKRHVAVSAWTEVAEATKTVDNLDAATEYDFFVRAKYADEGVSTADSIGFATITIAPKNLEQVGESTTDGASFQWEANGAATQYQWSTDNTNWSEAIDSTHVTLKGLNSGSSYTFYVRSYYSVTVQSAAINLPFKTECGTIATSKTTAWVEDFENGVDCWQMIRKNTNFYLPAVSTTDKKEGTKSLCFNGASTTSNAIAVLPMTAKDIKKLQISFFYKNGSTYTNRPQFGVGYITNPENVATYTQLKALDRSTAWTNTGNIDLSDATSGAYIAICYYGGSYDVTGFVDSVVVSEQPTCKAPKNLAASTLYNSATLTWTKGNEETAWVVEYSTFSDFSEVTAEDVETTPSIELTGLTTGTKYYARVKASCEENEFSAYSDVVEFTPNYIAPSNVAVASITTSGASVSWTANSGEAAWTLQYKKLADSEWTSVDVETTPAKTLSELKAGICYQVRVLAGTATSATETFSTECLESLTPLGWMEGFENFATGSYESTGLLCWDELNAAHTSGTYPQVYVNTESTYVKTGSKSLYFRSSNSTDLYAILPTFSGSYAGLQITFWHKEENETASGAFTLGYFTNIANEETFVAIKECERKTKVWQEEIVSIASVPTGARLAFRCGIATNNYYAGIDDISISEAPACAVPTGLTKSSVTAHSVILSWTSEASAWKVEYSKKADFSESQVADADKNPYTLSGLDAQTLYYARVKAVCGVSNESEYCDAISFTTECEPKAVSKENPWRENFNEATVDELPLCWAVVGDDYYTSAKVTEGGVETTNALTLTCERKSNNSYDVIALLPEFGVEIDLLQIDFQYKNSNSNSTYAQLQVGYYLAGTFTAVASLERVADAFAAASVELTGAPEGARMAIKLATGSKVAVSTAIVDNIVVSFHPTCYTPKNLVATATADGASLTWSAGKAEEEWNVRYKTTADDNWKTVENITTASYTLTGLVKDVEYEAQVRAYCSELDQSEWSASVTFTPLGETTSISNTEAEGKAVKVIENGQLMILHNGAKYNALGEKIQ